ncbi:unnamed protein product [Soboliphyme baturini]|uniref:PITH domain-containing protein n=1 Tax=Soboliphyme baturini TaxID=241478 RepID=A0A183IBQ1_9BILA|nr:unnamed protein product [Soboliphyme baturini]
MVEKTTIPNRHFDDIENTHHLNRWEGLPLTPIDGNVGDGEELPNLVAEGGLEESEADAEATTKHKVAKVIVYNSMTGECKISLHTFMVAPPQSSSNAMLGNSDGCPTPATGQHFFYFWQHCWTYN